MATSTNLSNGTPTSHNKTPTKHQVSAPGQTLETLSSGRSRFLGCSSISAYEVLGKLGEGTFGEVHRAKSKRDGSMVALKKILLHHEKDGFPITALREIKLLKMLSHENILQLKEMAVEHIRLGATHGAGAGKKKAVMHMVTPYMDHDLSGLLENPSVRITEPQIKCYMLQLLKGLEYLHGRQILHRDMKAANLLINNKGVLQIADFGLARPYDEPPPQRGKGGGEATRDYTTLVVTRWYRPPELLLQLRKYTTAIDMWGVGCVFGEMFKHKPIMAGGTDLKQIQMIFELVGSPTEENMPGWSELPGCENVRHFGQQRGSLNTVFREYGSGMINFLVEFLMLDWRKRITAIDALEHEYFKTAPLPAKPGEIPQFEESHELDRRRFREASQAKLPPAPAGGTVGMGTHAGEWGNGVSGRKGPAGPPPGQGAYGTGYAGQRNGHRPPPQGAPRGPPPGAGRDSHRPNTALPPKPPPPNTGMPLPRHGPPGAVRAPPRGDGAAGNMDTYIPAYRAEAGGEVAPGGPPPRPRRDWDGGRGGENGGLDYGGDAAGDHRDRRRDAMGGGGRRRSRSPPRHRDERDRDGREREREVPRERDNRDRERARHSHDPYSRRG